MCVSVIWSQLIPIHDYSSAPPLSNPVFSDILLVVWNPYIYLLGNLQILQTGLLSHTVLFYPAVCCTLPNCSSEEDDYSIKPKLVRIEIVSRNFSPKYIILDFVTEWAVDISQLRELPIDKHLVPILCPPQSTFMETVSVFAHLKQSSVSAPSTCHIFSEFLTGSWVEEDSANLVVKSSGTGYTGHG